MVHYFENRPLSAFHTQYSPDHTDYTKPGLKNFVKGTNQSFHPFIHSHKAHPGQVWAAARMLELLSGSKLIRDELEGRHQRPDGDLIQDRYSLRCLPQYMGPIVDGLDQLGRQITIDLRSHLITGHYDARECISAASLPLYEAVRQVVGKPPSANRPYIFNDNEQSLSDHLQLIAADIAAGGRIPDAVGNVLRMMNPGNDEHVE